MYTEPSLNNLLAHTTSVGNYGLQTSQGYAELQIYKPDYKHSGSKDYILVMQTKDTKALLAFLPSNKLKWHSIAAQERYRIQEQRTQAEFERARYYKSSKDVLYIEAYAITLASLTSYYARLADRLHSTLLDYVNNGKATMQQLELEFIKQEVSRQYIPKEFALFVLAKVNEHYAPQRYDRMPRFRRDFCRTLQYRLNQSNVPNGADLERALCIGAVCKVGGR